MKIIWKANLQCNKDEDNLFFDLCLWNLNFGKVSWFKVEVIQIGFFNIDAQLSPHDRARSWFYCHCSNKNCRGQQKWEDQALMRLISVRSAPSSKAWTMFTTCMVLLISWPIIHLVPGVCSFVDQGHLSLFFFFLFWDLGSNSLWSEASRCVGRNPAAKAGSHLSVQWRTLTIFIVCSMMHFKQSSCRTYLLWLLPAAWSYPGVAMPPGLTTPTFTPEPFTYL